MGRVVVTEFLTLDGVMEDPGGAEDFEHGGWAFKFDRGAEGDRFKADELANSEAHLLGRRTYEGFAKAWPEREGEFADRINSMPKYVVSSTLRDPTWNNTTVLDGELAAAIMQLKDRVEGDILVAGSNQLVHGLLAEDLVDELRLMVFPVVLGSGKRLFPDAKKAASFHLADCTVVGDGVLTLVYWPKAE